MSDHDATGETGQARNFLEDLLTPGSCAITGFAIAVMVLLGNNLFIAGTQSLLGQMFSSSASLAPFFLTWGIGTLLPVGASVYLARRALADVPHGWEATVARAAVLLAALGALFGLLTVLGALIHLS